MKVLICYKVSNLNLSVQEAEYEGEVLDSLEELDTIEELEAALQDYYDSVAYEDELEGELLRVEESEKRTAPPPTLGKQFT